VVPRLNSQPVLTTEYTTLDMPDFVSLVLKKNYGLGLPPFPLLTAQVKKKHSDH
jgi:hypothetical protein